jgi:hypothetical protein
MSAGGSTDGVAVPVEEAGDIHPKLRDLHGFWQKKRGRRPFPQRRDLDVIELWPWLGNLMLIEVENGGADYVYRVYGTVLADYFSRDLTGRRTSSLSSDVQTVVHAEYGRAIGDGQPIIVTRERTVQQRRIRASKLILPLGMARGTVDHLLVGLYLATPPGG